jgi:hypothetical protein
MQLAQSELSKLLAANEPSAGMYVRAHGDNLIIGRREPLGPKNTLEDDDRVRLTRLNAVTYGLSVKRHTGRWERTPFSGSMQEMVDVMLTVMCHLIAPTPGCTGTSGA